MKLEHKELRFSVKADDVDLEEGTFSGYASVFGNVDQGDDVIEKGAFTKTLKEHSSDVKVFRDHWDLIGTPLEMREDDKGLFVKGKISLTALGIDTLTLMRDGALDAMSIGFNTIKSVFDREKGIRFIKEVKLWEFSIVPWGMNTLARVEAVKSLALIRDEPPRNKDIDPDSLQSLLNDLKASNELLTVR